MASDKKNSTKGKSNEEVFSEFQNLRNQQRNLVNNLSTLELDLKEHKWVLTLFISYLKDFWAE